MLYNAHFLASYPPMVVAHTDYTALIADRIRWIRWEAMIEERGLCIDRPARTAHPDYPTVIYPVDYGYIPGTRGSDDEAVDCFRGTAPTGLVALLLTTDHRAGIRQGKWLYNCTPSEIYTVHGFINYAPKLLEGQLVMRQPMHTLWEDLL